MLKPLINSSIIPYIRDLCNDCKNTKTLPDEDKIGRIILIPKKPEWRYVLENTRPITLQETFAKIIQIILNRRISD